MRARECEWCDRPEIELRLRMQQLRSAEVSE